MRIVPKPRVKRKAMNSSIREIPVTISAFNIGIFVTPMIRFLGSFFMLRIATAAIVPRTVAIEADTKAIIRVFCKAAIIASS